MHEGRSAVVSQGLGQDNHAIAVYASDTVPPHQTMIALISRATPLKTNDGDGGPDSEHDGELRVRDDGYECEVLPADRQHCADADDARHEHVYARDEHHQHQHNTGDPPGEP